MEKTLELESENNIEWLTPLKGINDESNKLYEISLELLKSIESFSEGLSELLQDIDIKSDECRNIVKNVIKTTTVTEIALDKIKGIEDELTENEAFYG